MGEWLADAASLPYRRGTMDPIVSTFVILERGTEPMSSGSNMRRCDIRSASVLAQQGRRPARRAPTSVVQGILRP